MKFIKKLNEGLNEFPTSNEIELNNIDTVYDAETDKATSGFSAKYGATKNAGKKLSTAFGTSAEKFGNILSDQIDAWDPKGLTKNFRAALERRLTKNGWDHADYFLIWLQNTSDKNISALDTQAAEALMELLDKNIKIDTGDNQTQKMARLNSHSYMLQDNNLFSDGGKDIIYKLNALQMIGDPGTRDSYVKVDSHGDPILYYKENKNIDGDGIPVKVVEEKTLNPKYKPDSNKKDEKNEYITITKYFDISDPNNEKEIVDIPKGAILIPKHPSFKDMEKDGIFFDTDQIIKNLDGYNKDKLSTKYIGSDKKIDDTEDSDNTNSKRGSNKPTIWDILTKNLVNIKRGNFDRSKTTPAKWPKDIKEWVGNALKDYYLKNRKVRDYELRANKDMLKLSDLLSKPDNIYRDTFWNTRPNSSQSAGVGAAIQTYFTDPNGSKKLK